MILREDKSWLRLVFLVRRGTIIEAIWLRFLLVVGFAVAITVAYEIYGFKDLNLTTAPFSIVGLALSIFLGFRNNAAYDRFWEGRKLWGRLINTSRSLTRQVLTFTETDDEDTKAFQTRMVYRMMGYVHTLRHHLRKDFVDDEIRPFFSEDEMTAIQPELNRPTAILQWMADDARVARQKGQLDTFHHVEIERTLTTLTDIQGGCERIKATPIPLSHTALTHRMVAAYLWLLPLGLISTLDYLMPVMVALLAYAFFGLDALGEELEDPFGTDCNDLPLGQISIMVEQNLRQRLGETDLPAQPGPNALGVLL